MSNREAAIEAVVVRAYPGHLLCYSKTCRLKKSVHTKYYFEVRKNILRDILLFFMAKGRTVNMNLTYI